jgi:hypothetical protein
MDIQDLPESVIAFKKDVYIVVAQEFAPMIKKMQESGELSKMGSALTALM